MPNIFRVYYGDEFYQYNNFKGSCCRFMVTDGIVMYEEITLTQYENDYNEALQDNSLICG